MTEPVLFLAAGVTVFLVVVLVMLPFVMRPSAEAQRIQEVVRNKKHEPAVKIKTKQIAQKKALEIASGLRARLGLTENPKLQSRLLAAGLRGGKTGDIFFAAQFLVPLVGAFLGSFIPVNTAFWIGACALVGYIAPDMWLTYATGKRQHKIRRSLPDAIDLLVICVDAGLGLDQALLRVGEELAVSHAEVNEEFTQVNLEQRAGKPRLEAWQSLAERTKIEEFAAFVSMLTQTDRFGTPIIKSLTQYSEDLRLKRRQHAEEMAAKTKIKIIFPLVLCIFPCLFIVLLAPAILAITSGLKGMNH
jgi:tight adherence protein C